MAVRGMSTSLCGFIILALLILVKPAGADTFFMQVTHSDPVTTMGQTQPEKNDTSIVWLAKDRACMMSPGRSAVIVRVDKGMIYMVDYEGKKYSVMPLEDFGNIKKMAGIEDDDEAAEMAEAMQGMAAAMMTIKMKVTPTDETKKIKQWNARKYMVEMTMPMGTNKSEMWASDEIDIDLDLYRTVTSMSMLQMPGFAEAMKEMEKVKGIAVLSLDEAQMMGTTIKSTTELVGFSKKAAPAGIYDVPEGFKKAEMIQRTE